MPAKEPSADGSLRNGTTWPIPFPARPVNPAREKWTARTISSRPVRNLRNDQNGGLLEHASVYGNYYGTPRQYVLDKLNEGLDVVLEIDPQGALQVKKSYPDGVFVFIVPPSLDELSKRIYKRGTDAVDVIKRRLSAATSELAYASKYDYIVVNDEVERATDKVSKIIDVEHLKVGRTYYIVDEICQQKTTEQD